MKHRAAIRGTQIQLIDSNKPDWTEAIMGNVKFFEVRP